MAGTGRTPVLTKEEREAEQMCRQMKDDQKRESKISLMKVVAHATDVLVKRAPLSKMGELPHTRLAYHERIITGRRKTDFMEGRHAKVRDKK